MSEGGPLKAQSLSVMVRNELRKMGVTGYSIHGLRKKTQGNTLAEAEGTEHEIMAQAWPQSHRKWRRTTPNAQARRSWLYQPSRSCTGRSNSPKSGKPKNETGLSKRQPL